MKKTLALILSAMMVISCIATIFTFNASAAEANLFDWATEWVTVDGTAAGTVYQVNATVPSAEQFKYDYAIAYKDGNYYVGLKYTGTMSGTAASFGNGSGTNLRLWLRDPATGYVSYNYFIDVSYDGSAFKTQCKKNTNAAGNTGSTVNSYTDAAAYTASGKVTSTGCEILLVIPAAVIGNPYQLQAIVSVSNKAVSNYCLHSNQNASAPASAWLDGYYTVYSAEMITVDGTAAETVYQESKTVPAAEQFKYSYAIKYSDGKYYVTVNYYGTLTGTDASNGNGNGTNLRLWYKNTASAKKSDDGFIDVAYTPSGWRTRLFNNSSTTGHVNDLKYAYDLTEYPYTVKAEETETGAKIDLVIPATLISAGFEEQFIVSVSNKITSNYCLHSNQNPSAPTADWYAGAYSVYNSNISPVAVPAYATSENLATKETTKVTLDKVDATGTYTGNIADGVTGPTGYTNKWRGFRVGGNATFDLGKVYTNIGSVVIYTWPANKSGITKPTEIKVEASFDGATWTQIYDCTDFTDARWTSTADAVLTETIEFDNLVAARYIRVTDSGKWVFVSEIAVNAYTEIPTTAITNGYAYATDSANLITWNMGSTIDEVNTACKNHEWWSFATCEWDAAAGAYVVTDVSIGTNDKSTSDFGDYAIPRFGFVLAAHHSGTGAATELAGFIADLEKGDKVYTDIDLANLKATDTVKGVVSTEALSNAFKVATTQLLTSVGFAAGDVTIFVPFSGKSTIGDIAAAVRGVTKGDDTDYNYYGLITVDANGKVAGIYNTLGRPAGNKNDVAIPEGGYALATNAKGFSGIYVGDQVCLFNVDLDACAGQAATLTDAYFGIMHCHDYVAKVIDGDCLHDGYTEHVCACGDETEHTDIVKTGGHDVEGVKVETKAPTCVDGGYDYQICKLCKEAVIVKGSETDPTGKHTYDDKTDGFVHVHTCDVCGDVYYDNAKDEAALDIFVSHNNAYNWGTYQAEIVSTAGKTPKDINASASKWCQMYVVENIDGAYIVTAQYQNNDVILSTKCPEGGFLLIINSNNAAYKFSSNAHGYSLLGYRIMDPNGIVKAGVFGYDTNANPALIKHLYAVKPATAEVELVSFDKDGATETNEMTFTNSEADKFGIEVNLNTYENKYSKFETVVSFDPTIFEYIGTSCPGFSGSGAELETIAATVNDEFYAAGKIIITVKTAEDSTQYAGNVATLYFRLRGLVSTDATISVEKTTLINSAKQNIKYEEIKPVEFKLNGGDPIKSLGAQFNAEKVALRFGANYTRIAGKTVADMGMYLVSEKALGGKDVTVANVTANAKTIKVSANGIDAASYVEGQAFEDYASFNFTVAVTGLTGHESDNIVAVPYVLFEDGEVAYGEPMVRNYNDVAGVK